MAPSAAELEFMLIKNTIDTIGTMDNATNTRNDLLQHWHQKQEFKVNDLCLICVELEFMLIKNTIDTIGIITHNDEVNC